MDLTPPLGVPARPRRGRLPTSPLVRARERAAVEGVLDGEPDRYRCLVERHRPRLLHILARMTGNPTDAEDLAQQTLTAAYAALDRFDTRLPFRAWVNRIAINLAKDHLKAKRRTEVALPEGEGVATEAACFAGRVPDPEGHANADERLAHLARALAELSWMDREVLVLKELEGLSYEEMGRVLAKPVTALKIRVVRARRRLRELSAQWGVEQ